MKQKLGVKEARSRGRCFAVVIFKWYQDTCAETSAATGDVRLEGQRSLDQSNFQYVHKEVISLLKSRNSSRDLNKAAAKDGT